MGVLSKSGLWFKQSGINKRHFYGNERKIMIGSSYKPVLRAEGSQSRFLDVSLEASSE